MATMKTVGSSKTDFKLSESEPQTEWGHTGYITVTPDTPLLIDDQNELVIFFTPKPGTTFEEIEELVHTLDKKLGKIHFNIHPRSR